MPLRCMLLLLAITLGFSSQPANAEPCSIHGPVEAGISGFARSETDAFTGWGIASKDQASGVELLQSGSHPLHPSLHPEGWCHVASAFVPARGVEVDRLVTAKRESRPTVRLGRRTSPAADIFRPPPSA